MVQTAKLSVEEYHRIIETGIFHERCIELLNGELIELAPETPFHANCHNKLFKYLLLKFDGLADVRSAHPITLSTSEPQPDLVLAKLPETLYDRRHPYPEDIYLLVEISYSTLDYDLNEKKHSYANAGIPEYWIVDLENQRLIVFRNPQDRDYNETFEYRAGVVELMAFPEVKLEVIRLLIDLN